jgi:hypothetical protein
LRDILGKVLFQQLITHSEQQLDASDLPPGVYLLTVYSNRNYQVFRIKKK